MPRMARVVVPGVPHHITQRGNNRQPVFFTDDDRRLYLSLLHDHAQRFGMAIRGYCLMSNHVHLVAVPSRPESLAKTLAGVHLKYAQFINRAHGRSGHLWQNRFYSCPLDAEHELAAVRYVERNPVRARLVRFAWRYPWSSAAERCGESHPVATAAPRASRSKHAGRASVTPAELLEPDVWSERYRPHQWRRLLQQPEDDALIKRLRRNTFNGRPLGSDRFIAKLEAALNRRLREPKMGRPPATTKSDKRRSRRTAGSKKRGRTGDK